MQVQRNNSLWLAGQLAQTQRDLAALKAQTTQYVVDASGAAQAIVGNLTVDPQGNSTGLVGFGVAAWTGTKWVKVPDATEINEVPVPLTGAAWITPGALLNSWANVGSGFATAAYLKDPLGFVHLQGTVNGGATNTSIFTLPAGYRPGATIAPAYGINTASVGQNLQISTGGSVTPEFAGGGTQHVSLDSITFLAEN